MDPMDASGIQTALSTRVFGRRLVYLSSTRSTNDVAKNAAAQGAPEGTVILAEEQSAGRGRLGRRWLAPPGTCILCSILFRPDLPPTQAQRLTMLCSLAAADAIAQVAGLQVSIKWPNDLVVKSPIYNLQSPIPTLHSPSWKKLAGVLTETDLTGERLDFAVVGIGINVNVEPEVLPTLAPDATSIELKASELAMLLDGIDLRRVNQRQRFRRVSPNASIP